jgi:hypothetical protein
MLQLLLLQPNMYRVDIMKHFYGTILSIPNITWISSSAHHSPSLPKSQRKREYV